MRDVLFQQSAKSIRVLFAIIVSILFAVGASAQSLTVNVPTQISVDEAGDVASLTFNGTAGDTYSLELTNSTFDGCVSVWLNVTNPDGSSFGSTATCGENNVGFSLINLPQTGTYTVTTNAGGSGTGSGSITLSTEVTGQLSSNQSKQAEINIPGQDGIFTVSGSAGQIVGLELTDSTFGGGCISLQMTLNKPDGSQLANSGTCGSGNISLPLITLPDTGTYTVYLIPSEGGTGTGSITLSNELSAPLTLNNSAPVEIDLPGQSSRFNFQGAAGQIVSLGVTNSTFGGGCISLTLSVNKPDGSHLTDGSTCGMATSFCSY